MRGGDKRLCKLWFLDLVRLEVSGMFWAKEEHDINFISVFQEIHGKWVKALAYFGDKWNLCIQAVFRNFIKMHMLKNFMHFKSLLHQKELMF